MVFEEVIIEVISYGIRLLLFYECSIFDFNVECFLNKGQILCEVCCSKGNLKKVYKTVCDIITEVFSFGDGNHIVCVDLES